VISANTYRKHLVILSKIHI